MPRLLRLLLGLLDLCRWFWRLLGLATNLNVGPDRHVQWLLNRLRAHRVLSLGVFLSELHTRGLRLVAVAATDHWSLRVSVAETSLHVVLWIRNLSTWRVLLRLSRLQERAHGRVDQQTHVGAIFLGEVYVLGLLLLLNSNWLLDSGRSLVSDVQTHELDAGDVAHIYDCGL